MGPNPSQIAGHIDANGQVVLVNQSGVTFYNGAQVNTAGLVVSAAGVSNMKKFINGGALGFDQAGSPNAQINNAGMITIKEAGLAALVAPSVVNSGIINRQARPGRVGGREDRDGRSRLAMGSHRSLSPDKVTQTPAPERPDRWRRW